ncbi:glycosyl hydrolase family 95 catalytic domain-containing protein [Cohnella terricola]|uniref:glycosyl hydrolase family 95 catalytic domain-containing protein n=1 Tax=Cohnella terricola TaxID=1289167 RepID=UPI001C9764A5|nr:carbohydrate-binding protein [Cohnella terricola]
MNAVMQRRAARAAASFVLAATLVLSALPAGIVKASPNGHSFNTGTGTLNVDYASYLSQHDIVYNAPTTEPKSGLTVGNGRVGAMVWNRTGGLTMQVSGVDASQEGFASQGLIDLYTNPGLDASYSSYQQRLNLYDGTVTTKYGSDRTVTIMGSPNSEVIGIHVEDSRSGVSSVSLDLSLWDVSNFSGGDVPDINTWRTVSTFADPTVAGFSRGQTDANKFGYTLAATVEGASFTTQTVDSRKVRLNIAPSSAYTIWIASASRLNAPGNDSVNRAKALLNDVKGTGYNSTFTQYKNWWHDFWSRSFVRYSNAAGDANYLENFYYLGTYMIAAGGFANYPFHFINGAFSAVRDDDSNKWSYAYWYWNQRDVYHSFLASNHAEMVNIFNNLYSRNFNVLKSYTMTRYGIDGIWVPETMGWDGNARGTINSDYTKNTLSTAAEAALNMYAQYKYTNDSSYLSGTAYPFMKEAAKFYAGMLSYDSGTGKYFMASSNVHEQHWNVRNAITDLAAIRALFPVTIQTSQALGLDASLRTQWQNILNNLVAYPVDPADPGKYYPHSPPLSQNRNNENVILELAWPYSVSGIGAPDQQMLVNNYNSRPYPYGGNNVWDPAPIQAARLGLGNEANLGMKMMLQRYQDYPNGRTTNTNGEFEYVGVHLLAMNESLLQSYNDKIRVFPAVPSDSSFDGKFTLLASGGFLVSSEKENGEIKYVGVKSLYGNAAKVVNPWGTQEAQVRRATDNAIVLTSSAGELSFSTTPNATYVVERTAKKLSAYGFETLTGTRNEGPKTATFNGAVRTLGKAGAYIGPMPTFYPDANYGGKGVSLPPGSYNITQMQAAGIANDSISSIRVPAGVTVVAYADGAFDGQSWTFTADNPNLAATGNDKVISSFIITAGGGGNPPGGSAPIGSTIVFKATVNGQFVTAENAGASALIANRAAAGSWEQFAVVDAGGGTIALKAQINGKYVSAANAGAGSLIAQANAIGQWEKFRWIDNGDGTFSLQAVVNNQYVCSENAGGAALIANRNAIGPWEKFQRS